MGSAEVNVEAYRVMPNINTNSKGRFDDGSRDRGMSKCSRYSGSVESRKDNDTALPHLMYSSQNWPEANEPKGIKTISDIPDQLDSVIKKVENFVKQKAKNGLPKPSLSIEQALNHLTTEQTSIKKHGKSIKSPQTQKFKVVRDFNQMSFLNSKDSFNEKRSKKLFDHDKHNSMDISKLHIEKFSTQ